MKLGVRGPIPGRTLREKAEVLRRTDFDGIELGSEFLNTTPEEILQQLDGTGICVSAIVGSIGLLNTNIGARRDAIELDKKRLDMAAKLNASGVIEVPVFGPPQFPDISPIMTIYELERRLLIAGLKELIGQIEQTGVPIILEPLNRYETHFINRVGQAVEICEEVGTPTTIKILADLFHMSIEEVNIANALKKGGEYIGYIHLADSNRLEPGAGHTDFVSAIGALKSIGYDGWLTIESGASTEPEDALYQASGFMRSLWDAS
jgi:sugar phosphate isomerase/epimerase